MTHDLVVSMNLILGVFASASKIVLLMLAATACAGFLMGKLESKDFMLALTGVFTYYFTQRTPGTSDVFNPGGSTTTSSTSTVTPNHPVQP